MASAVILSLVLVLCCAFVVRWRKRREAELKRLPPGPRPWPIVGNMFQLSPLLNQCFWQLSKQYGPLVFARLGSMKVLVACSAKMAKTIIYAQDSDFCSRPQNSASIGIVTFDFRALIMGKHGERWRKLKKILVTELFSVKRMATFKRMRTVQMVSTLRLIKEESDKGKVVELREMLYQCFSNVITSMIANKAYFGPQSSVQERRELFGVISLSLRLFSSFNPGDYFHMLKPFDVLGVERESRKCKDRFVDFFRKIIDEHRENQGKREESYVDDFVDILLSCPGLEGEKHLSDVTIMAIMLDMLLAGTDTSSGTTEWALAELLRNPKIMKNAQEELESVVGRERLVTEDDIPNLKYINAILRENFRYHPVVPTLVPRVSPKGGCQLEGYFIPEDTTILVNVWAIGRDPACWERPDEFDPDRFLGDNPRDVKGQDFELLPFGGGRRMCTGYNLGIILTHLAVANLIHCFDWSLADGQSPQSLNVEQMSGLMAGMRYPLRLHASPRLPSAVFASSPTPFTCSNE